MCAKLEHGIERKRKAEEAFNANEDMIVFLLPPKSAKNDYVEQKPAKYVFKCMDGDIQIPEYGILRTEFYYQERIDELNVHIGILYLEVIFGLIDVYPNDEQVNLEARKADKNGHIFNYSQFSKSSVKYFTDALFGFMPECTDIGDTMQLMNFLLFGGQANAG